jgi:phospholipid/cholesterol/gamma-HCH transport system ATP-binding protein
MKEEQYIAQPGQQAEPVISIRGVSKSFGDLHVLKNVDLDVYKGENLVVLGKSGGGKSVLIKLLVGLFPPDKGSVKVLGKEVPELKGKELDELRLKVGFSFQGSALYDSMSVRQNLAFPLVMNKKHLSRQEVQHAIEEALEAVGLSSKINQMPTSLSGGQRKRIGIARTLILKPEIMLYDEPTAGLDPATSEEINELIREVQQKYNTSAIIITHDLVCAKYTGDRIAVLIDGAFARTGTFSEVFDTDNEIIRSFYNYNFIQ